MRKKKLIAIGILLCFSLQNIVVFSAETKYPDYSFEFLGEDKLETFNRKMFNFNLKLNRYALRPIHILWASLIPKYGMDRIYGVTNNIEYPIRLVSSLIQRDFKNAKNETIRFFTNTTIGIGGLFDPAKHIFKLEQSKEDMDQALAGCNLKTGRFLVLPGIPATCCRGVFGSLLDIALNPGSYIATPILAMVKAGLFINKTSFMQPLIKMVEDQYADPYDIARKAYGLERYIKCSNLDRLELEKLSPAPTLNNDKKIVQKLAPIPVVKTSVFSEVVVVPDLVKGGTQFNSVGTENFSLTPDIILPEYNPQNPVVDSMRTALFSDSEVDKSIWNEFSIWNRSFSHRIKTAGVKFAKDRDEYKYRYILNKDKNSPVAIIYPSIGEGINSSHSTLWAKMFYDAGYSVVIQGSHFEWEFVKSMPKGYYPGLPDRDSEQLRRLTALILYDLKKKYGYSFENKLILGTSFGAVATLFVGEKEFKHNTLGHVKYISICPPVELLYAMAQIDKISKGLDSSSDNFKQKTAVIAAKILKLYDAKDDKLIADFSSLPFNEEEGKLITSFIMHQKLSDLIYTIEESKENTSKHDLYNQINNMDYKDYAQKYLLSNGKYSTDDLSYETSLYYISDFLEHNNNYKIYHSVNDYLTNNNQLKRLKDYCGDKVVLLDNGAHLGFTYRKEFLDDLKKTIASLY